jgi:hypothetical protein
VNVVSWFAKKLPLLVLMIVVYAFSYSVGAASVSTQVTVSNTAPDITVAPAEDPISSPIAPTNVGNSVTFKATATDTNGDAYRFAVCKTNAITPGGASAPTCTDGNWCISASTTSGQQASCSYSVLSGDAEVNNWYGFVCDVISGGTCSVADQGTGDSGSPFYVNHNPSFTQMTASTADPGGVITFTSTASDADIDTAADTVHLIVCSVAGATSNGCTVPANQLCISTSVATNPTCDYTLPAVKQSGATSYYSYVYDSHNLGATNNPFPSRTYIVNNVAPAVSNVIVNGAENIQLTAGSTTAVIVTATVTDANSCQNVSNLKTSLYRSGIGFSACDAVGEMNYNYCYSLQTCTVVGGTCASATDASADYACT